MSIRSAMLTAARQSIEILGPQRRDRIVQFLRSQFNEDGGFADRAGKSDLYYTVFGLEAIAALANSAECPVSTGRVQQYLESFGGGERLDLVHVACLARAWAEINRDAHHLSANSQENGVRPYLSGVLQRIESHRCADGGYSQSPVAQTGTAYGCFLAVAAYQDLGAELPDPTGVAASLAALATADGGFANDCDLPIGLTPATAAAVTALAELGQPVPPSAAEWLLARQSPEGGFLAMPEAPIPDLLSTATALHALAQVANCPSHISNLKSQMAGSAATRDFVLGLLTDSGGFAGSAADPTPDCEYSYYGLIALGHMAR